MLILQLLRTLELVFASNCLGSTLVDLIWCGVLNGLFTPAVFKIRLESAPIIGERSSRRL
jgi:hypothetical protein